MSAAPPTLAEQVDRVSAPATAGYAVALHVRYQRPTHLFHHYPEGWSRIYSAEGLVMRDPTVIWAFAHVGTVAWSALADPERILARAAEHGMAFGLTVSVEEGGSRSLASFARPDREFTPEEAAGLERGMRELHELTAPGAAR